MQEDEITLEEIKCLGILDATKEDIRVEQVTTFTMRVHINARMVQQFILMCELVTRQIPIELQLLQILLKMFVPWKNNLTICHGDAITYTRYLILSECFISVTVDDVDAHTQYDDTPDDAVRAERKSDIGIRVRDSGHTTHLRHRHTCLHLEPINDYPKTQDEEPHPSDDSKDRVVRIQVSDKKYHENKQPDIDDKVKHW